MRPAFDQAPPGPAPRDEEDLARRLAAFDSDAWSFLFTRDYPRLHKFAFVRTGDDGAAQDIAAEVFEEAARRIGRFEFRGYPVSAWLFKMARNITAGHLEQRRRRRLVPLEAAEATVPRQGGLANVESLADVSRAMEGLTSDQQEVIGLRFVAGCDLIETAKAMDRSVGAVKVLQHRALQGLRKQLGRDGSGR